MNEDLLILEVDDIIDLHIDTETLASVILRVASRKMSDKDFVF